MKEKKIWPKKSCKSCKKMFQPFNNSQNYCKNPCGPKPRLTIAESNALWALRDEDYYNNRKKRCKDNFIQGTTRIL